MSAGAFAVERFFSVYGRTMAEAGLTVCQRVQMLIDDQSVVVNLRPLIPVADAVIGYALQFRQCIAPN
jgi:hypothetical protein